MIKQIGMKPSLAVIGSALILILAMGLFYQSWSYPFILDDINKIQNNPDLRAPKFSLDLWLQSYAEVRDHARNDPSRPLTFFLYWLCWQVGGGATEPFHILNTLIHAVCAILFGLLAAGIAVNQLQRPYVYWAFFAASLLFLTLPINTGTVIYTYGLSDVLSALFALWILLIVSRPTALGVKLNLLTIFLFFLALTTKQSSVVIPAMILAVNHRQWRSALVLLGMASIYVLARWTFFGRIGDLEAHEVYPFWDYLGSQGVLYFKYIRLAIWPDHLTLDHAVFPRFYPTSLRIASWLVWLFLTLASGWVVLNNRMGMKRVIAAGWLIFVLALIPTSSIFATTDLFVERRAYLAVSGLILIFFTLAVWVEDKKPHWGKALVGLALIFATHQTWQRTEIFSKKENVWREVLKVYPGDTRARMNLSTAYLEKGQWQDAKEILDQLLQEEPRNFQAWSNLGTIYHSDRSPFHSPDLALRSYRNALEIEPDHVNSLSNAGFLFLMIKEPEEAISLFRRALELSPRSPQFHYGLGQANLMKGNRDEAVRSFEQALIFDPGFKKARESLQGLASKK